MPPSNIENIVHYQDTILNKVNPERIYNYIDQNLKIQLMSIFGKRRIAVWGSRDSASNRARYEKMKPGDDILIVESDIIKTLGIIACKTINPELSRELWKNIHGGSEKGWDLIYFIANSREIDLPFDKFKQIFNYKKNWSLRGFTSISNDKLETFYSKYDDLYSILIQIKNGEKIKEKDRQLKLETGEIPLQINDMQYEYPVIKESTEHMLMQWKLSYLGLKAGSKVWVPKNDQTKINKKYNFSEFELEFTSGIDIPSKYVENIDVVWKEEFRIDAAFEIEHSTSIYSGLLRFSDLSLIAPNSNYPLFIVAPSDRRNRVVEQLKRPTFKKIEFGQKVRFLSYENVDSIDKFFKENESGLNIDVFIGKSEKLQ